MRIVHYVNQFFGGIGGEEKAGASLESTKGPVGPGRLLERAIGSNAEVVLTIICGDNYAAENLDEVTAQVVQITTESGADLFVAGPCFEAGRYGIAAGAVCDAVQRELGIPAITGMAIENPGLDLFGSTVYIIDSGANIAQMQHVMARIAGLGIKLADGETIGRPSEEGYHPRGFLRGEFVGKAAAVRGADMLESKLLGLPYESELPIKAIEPAPMPAAVTNLSGAKIAIVTDGGLVPPGNPDRLKHSLKEKIWGAYNIENQAGLQGGEWEVAHGGYDSRPVLQDPDRLVPVDVLREFEKAGLIGKLHDEFLSTTGQGNPLENSRNIGREMADRLKKSKVDAVILTST